MTKFIPVWISQDGRVGWPTVFKYRIRGPGFTVRSAVLPLNGELSQLSYEFEIYDIDEFEVLSRAGKLQSTEHRGSTPELIDNQKTS